MDLTQESVSSQHAEQVPSPSINPLEPASAPEGSFGQSLTNSIVAVWTSFTFANRENPDQGFTLTQRPPKLWLRVFGAASLTTGLFPSLPGRSPGCRVLPGRRPDLARPQHRALAGPEKAAKSGLTTGRSVTTSPIKLLVSSGSSGLSRLRWHLPKSRIYYGHCTHENRRASRVRLTFPVQALHLILRFRGHQHTKIAEDPLIHRTENGGGVDFAASQILQLV